MRNRRGEITAVMINGEVFGRAREVYSNCESLRKACGPQYHNILALWENDSGIDYRAVKSLSMPTQVLFRGYAII